MQDMPEHELKLLPYQQVKQIKDSLNAEFKIEARSLGESYLTDDAYANSMSKLKAKYKLRELEALRKLQATVGEQKRVRELISARQGGMQLSAQDEATLRMQLGTEAEKLVFPTVGEPEKQTPLSISALRTREAGEKFTKIQASIRDFAAAAKPSKRWHLEWGPHPRDEKSLVDQYRKWRVYTGYDYLDPIVQQQLDMEWDDWMAGDEQYDKWWYNKKDRTPVAEIRALRAKGPASKAIQRKVTNVSPIGQSILDRKPSQVEPEQPRVIKQRNIRTGQERISYDGGRTWQMVSG